MTPEKDQKMPQTEEKFMEQMKGLDESVSGLKDSMKSVSTALYVGGGVAALVLTAGAVFYFKNAAKNGESEIMTSFIS